MISKGHKVEYETLFFNISNQQQCFILVFSSFRVKSRNKAAAATEQETQETGASQNLDQVADIYYLHQDGVVYKEGATR